MRLLSRKAVLSAVLAVVVCGALIAVFLLNGHKPVPQPTPIVSQSPVSQHEIIGTSVQGRDIESYTFGTGSSHILFVGGVHGGYEWNSVMLAYAFIDYFTAHPDAVPRNVTVHIIPALNVDGMYAAAGKTGRFTENDITSKSGQLGFARFNANGVDLNRNFGCKWKPTSTWQSKTVSAGTAPFSEPEAATLKKYVQEIQPSAAVFWHSQSNAVYASECTAGILPKTIDVMDTYAKSAGYPAVKTFDAYEITGDAEGWLASVGIPAITVELKTHNTIEWDKNLAGMKALLKYFAQ